MLAAVRINWRLWTILQAELLDPDCQLPDEVRSNVLSLAQFIDKHTVDIIADPKPGKLDVLIAINREIAGGLFASPATAADGDSNATGAATALAAGDRTVAVSA